MVGNDIFPKAFTRRKFSLRKAFLWIFIPDLIMMDCDLLKHIDFMVDPAKNFVVNMKDGKIHKNTIK